MSFVIRQPTQTDQLKLLSLYEAVTAASDGIARRPNEITSCFISELLLETGRSGLMLVMEDHQRKNLVGAIHATYGQLECLRHVMGHLTILIHPSFQKMGLSHLM